MIVNLSEEASNVLLNALSDLMDGGSIEILSEHAQVLAVLPLSTPATTHAAGGELEFNTIGEATAVTTGKAETARILRSDGRDVFLVDVGDTTSNAVIKLNTTQITRDGPVKIGSFRLAMP